MSDLSQDKSFITPEQIADVERVFLLVHGSPAIKALSCVDKSFSNCQTIACIRRRIFLEALRAELFGC